MNIIILFSTKRTKFFYPVAVAATKSISIKDVKISHQDRKLLIYLHN